MIIGSNEPLTVGARVLGIAGNDGIYRHDQPFVVLREATLAEWVSDTDGIPMPPSQMAALKSGRYKFYEVSVD